MAKSEQRVTDYTILGTLKTEEMNGPRSGQWPIDWLSARLVKRIGCFHSDVDFGVTTHLLLAASFGGQPISGLANMVDHEGCPSLCWTQKRKPAD